MSKTEKFLGVSTPNKARGCILDSSPPCDKELLPEGQGVHLIFSASPTAQFSTRAARISVHLLVLISVWYPGLEIPRLLVFVDPLSIRDSGLERNPLLPSHFRRPPSQIAFDCTPSLLFIENSKCLLASLNSIFRANLCLLEIVGQCCPHSLYAIPAPIAPAHVTI